MADKRAETMVADNGITEDVSRRLENITRLSDKLVGTFGRLAVKEALTEVPPGEATLQQPHAEPARLAVPMGKPLQLVRDEFYFIARCPVNGGDSRRDPRRHGGHRLAAERAVARDLRRLQHRPHVRSIDDPRRMHQAGCANGRLGQLADLARPPR